MLVLSRRQGEYLVLGDNIFIKVMDVKPGGEEGDKVKLAIMAPDEVTISRGESFGTQEELRRKMNSVQSRKVGKRAEEQLRRMGLISGAPAESPA